jgi:hypothetical protein
MFVFEFMAGNFKHLTHVFRPIQRYMCQELAHGAKILVILCINYTSYPMESSKKGQILLYYCNSRLDILHSTSFITLPSFSFIEGFELCIPNSEWLHDLWIMVYSIWVHKIRSKQYMYMFDIWVIIFRMKTKFSFTFSCPIVIELK